MAEITFGGLATGLPTDEIITKLLAVQRRPLDRLENQKEYEATRLKAYAQLNTRLDDLRKAVDAMNLTSEVRTTKANLSSTSAFTATSNSAATGSYNIAVTQLAQVQKDVSDGYASNTASIFGTGTFTVNGEAITIDATNNSLQGLASAINAVAKESGVSATIINDGSGGATAYRLVLTGKDASTAIDLTGTTIPFSTTTTQTAQQAKITVDGIEVVSNSNTITGVISGVTLNLNATSPVPDPAEPTVYTPTRMDIVADNDALKEKISTFVSAYNKVMEWINEGYQAKTDKETTSDSTDEDILSDYLRGDSTVNGIKRGLQTLLTDSVEGSGSFRILSEIGITTNRDGTLNLNSSKLDTALEDGLDGMVSLLAGEENVDGVMKKFNSYLLEVTSATKGMYAAKRDRYETRIDRLDDQIAQKEMLMEKFEINLRAKFNAMELLISNLNSQSSFLTQQMDMLSKMTTGGN
jgi:flagellar hook-associated protein 2